MEDCGWLSQDPLYQVYHDDEWGVPVTEDSKLFEMLVLEGMQAGLSWITVLRKRENFRKAFHNFSPQIVANFSTPEIDQLLSNPNLIRNRLKIESVVTNAQAFVRMQQEWGSFSRYLWSFVDQRPEIHAYTAWKHIPSVSPLSHRLSHDLKRRGFRFVGPTICYSYCQATGIVMDHVTTCHRYVELSHPAKISFPS